MSPELVTVLLGAILVVGGLILVVWAAVRASRSNGQTAFVIGAEGRGLHEHTAKRCDFLIRIPMTAGGVASLNASVAAGVVLFEWRRRQ